MADKFSYVNSGMSQEAEGYFKAKNFIYVNDMNNGNYGGSNQILFDLTGLYNQDKMVNASECFLVIPIIATVCMGSSSGTTIDHNSVINDFSLAFKNGYHNLISSIQVEYDNKTVQQLTPFIHQYVSFKRASTMTQEKLKTEGALYGYYPDNQLSWIYNNNASTPYGNGLSNNINKGLLDTSKSWGSSFFNNGMFCRQLRTSFNPNQNGMTQLRALNGNINNELKDYTIVAGSGTGATAKNAQVFYTTACIKLSHISSFFENMPMTKGFLCKLMINVNMGSLQIDTDVNKNMSLNGSNISFPNGMCPIMISSIGSGTYNKDNLGNLNSQASNINVSISIAKQQNAIGNLINGVNIPNHNLPQCRVYAPVIDLCVDPRDDYINENRSKLIQWDDYYFGLISDVTGTINYNITNAISGIKGILAIPMIARSIHGLCSASAVSGNGAITTPFSQLLSPFCSDGTGPLSITQLNVQLSGENQINNFINYNFELFTSQIHLVNAINGNLSDEFGQSVIGLNEFENLQRYYYVDLSRREHDLKAAKSVTIVGLNNNLVKMDLYIYIIYGKSGVIDVETGKLTM